MSEEKKQFKSNDLKSRYILLLFVIWTAMIMISLFWNQYAMRTEMRENARINARASFEKDLVYRLWATMHGGVYVPVTEDTPPNPNLEHISERDIETPSGRKLTLMNPAYMTRQMHELGLKEYGLIGHITSLNPLRYQNRPDDWERQALEAFEEGETEVTSIETIGEQSFLRFMRPLITEKGCLSCHAEQGYKEGDIRGGISVSVPMEPYNVAMFTRGWSLIGGHLLLWLLGVVGFKIVGWRVMKLEEVKKIRGDELKNLQLVRVKEAEDSKRAMLAILQEKKRTETELRGITERLSLATKAASIGIWDLDVKTNVLVWDESMYEIYGVKKEDVPSTMDAWRKLAHQEDLVQADRDFEDALSGGQDFETEFRIIRPDGEIRHIRAIASIHRDGDGSPVRVIGLNWDITSERKAELQYEQILKTAIDGFVILDTKGGFKQVNDAFCQMTGYSREKLLTFHIKDLEEMMNPQEVHEQMTKVIKQGFDKFETRLRCKNGDVINIQVSIQFDKLSGDRLVFFAQDITKRKNAELELQERISELQRWHKVTLGREERIQELKDEVNKLLARSGEQDKYFGQQK